MADAAQPSALSLSVSAFKLEGSATLSKRPSSRSLKVPEPDDGREYISHFDAEDRQARPAKPVRAIPCKPNTTLATPAAAAAARLAAGDAPASTLDGRFAAATEQREGDGVYGLVSAPAAPGSSARARAPAPSSRPDASELRLDELPDAPSHDAYDDTPVDGFGEAMLRGMGMTEETTTGTVAFVPRPARMGLGAKPTDVMTGKRSYRQLVDAAGATKSVVRGDEVLIDAATLGPHKGKEMTIVSGRHAGLQCVVQLVSDDSGRARVRLLPSEQDVELDSSALSEPGMDTWVQRPGSASASGQRPPQATAKRRNGATGTDAKCRPAARAPARGWLHESIRVRICDKGLDQGRAYLKKATVVTVYPGGMCVLQVDGAGVLDGVKPKQIETVVSKDASVPKLLLRGQHTGRFATLLRKEKDSAIVQLVESKEVVTTSLDDVADFVGGDVDL